MAETSHPSILAGAHPNMPRVQGMPRLPVSSLYPPDRLPIITEFNPEWSDWKYALLHPTLHKKGVKEKAFC